jgi:hypothetical protein
VLDYIVTVLLIEARSPGPQAISTVLWAPDLGRLAPFDICRLALACRPNGQAVERQGNTRFLNLAVHDTSVASAHFLTDQTDSPRMRNGGRLPGPIRRL